MSFFVGSTEITDVKVKVESTGVTSDLDELIVNSTTVWQRASVPAATGSPTSASVSDNTIKGSDYYTNNDGSSISSASVDFSGYFTNSPFTSFRNAGAKTGSAAITATPYFNTSTGIASVDFDMSTAGYGVGVYNATYTFEVYASNADGESTSASYWTVDCQFTVTQGLVPQISGTYGTIYTTSRSENVASGNSDVETYNGSWADRFTIGDAPTTHYSRSGSGILNNNTYVTANFTPINTTTGSTSHTHTLSSSAPVGSHYFRTWETGYAYNKYGRSAIAEWRTESTHTVGVAPTIAAAYPQDYTTNAGTRAAPYTRSGSWAVRFDNADTYTRNSGGKSSGAAETSVSLDALTSGGDTAHNYSITAGAPSGSYACTSQETVTASNDFGSVTAYWTVNVTLTK